MSFKVETTDLFVRRLKPLPKKYPSLGKELNTLNEQLSASPELGTSLGRNCYKIRLAIQSKEQASRVGPA